MKDPVRLVPDAFAAAVDPDELVHFVEIRRHVIVRDRPVVADAVQGLATEIVRAEAERDSPPMVGAAAEHARAPPEEARPGRRRVRLAVYLPAAVARVELPEGTYPRGRAAPRGGVVGDEHRRVLGRVPGTARLEHEDV